MSCAWPTNFPRLCSYPKFIADMAGYDEPVRKAAELTQKLADKQDKVSAAERRAALAAIAAAGTYEESAAKAKDAADKVTRGEASVAEASRAAARAAGDLARAELKAAAAQELAGKSASNLAGKLRGPVFAVTGLSDVMGVANSKASMFSRVMAGASLATGLMEAPLSGVIVAAGGLASGLVAAGAGLGVFGLVAKSVYSQVSSAVQAYGKAQSTTGKASATAMKQYQAQLAALPPAQREVARSIIGAQTAWQNFVASNTAGVGKVMSQGIGLLPKVFAAMQPFLAPVEKALSHIIAEVGRGLGSAGFHSFIGMLARNSGPMLEKLATAIGHVIVGLGGIIRAFMPMAQTIGTGLDKITAKFAKWGTSLTQHSGFQSLVAMAKADMPYVIDIVKNLGDALLNVGKSATGLSTFANSKALLQLADPLSRLLDYLSKANPMLLRLGLYFLAAHSAAGKLSNVVSGVKDAWGGISKGIDLIGKFGKAAEGASTGAKLVAGATRIWTAAQAALDIVLDANPISLIIIAIAALVAAFVILWKKSSAFRDFWKDVWKGIVTAALAAWHFLDNDVIHPIERAIAGVVKWIKSHWMLLPLIFLGPLGIVVAIIATHFHQIVGAVSRMWHTVVGWFKSLPGAIIGVFAGAGQWLWNAGMAVINGFLGGLESAWHAVSGWLSSVGGWISHLKGPLDKDAVLLHPHGQAIMQGLLDGLSSRMPALRSQLGQITSTIRGTGGGFGAGGYGYAGSQTYGAGGQTIIVNQYIAGSVIAETQLRQKAQQGVLRYTRRNPGNGLFLPGRLS